MPDQPERTICTHRCGCGHVVTARRIGAAKAAQRDHLRHSHSLRTVAEARAAYERDPCQDGARPAPQEAKHGD